MALNGLRVLRKLRSLNNMLNAPLSGGHDTHADGLGPLVVDFFLEVKPLEAVEEIDRCFKPVRHEIRLFAESVGLAREAWVKGALFKLCSDEKVARSRKKHGTKPTEPARELAPGWEPKDVAGPDDARSEGFRN